MPKRIPKSAQHITITDKRAAILNNVVTIEDIQDMYGLSKSTVWGRVKKHCVFLQRKPRGQVLVELSSVLQHFGTPKTALPTFGKQQLTELRGQGGKAQ